MRALVAGQRSSALSSQPCQWSTPCGSALLGELLERAALRAVADDLERRPAAPAAPPAPPRFRSARRRSSASAGGRRRGCGTRRPQPRRPSCRSEDARVDAVRDDLDRERDRPPSTAARGSASSPRRRRRARSTARRNGAIRRWMRVDLGDEARHVAAAQRHDVRDAEREPQQPGDRSGRDREEGDRGVEARGVARGAARDQRRQQERQHLDGFERSALRRSVRTRTTSKPASVAVPRKRTERRREHRHFVSQRRRARAPGTRSRSPRRRPPEGTRS